MSAWIEMIQDDDADSALKDALELARTPHGTVDNVMRVHSLRPATLHAHVDLYRAVLHNETNTLPGWFQETLASYVSILNHCDYSLANHWANARHLIGNDDKAERIIKALQSGSIEDIFDNQELQLLHYAHKLTLRPAEMVQQDVADLKDAGVDDAQILEANQIICYFNYVNRLLNGLGVTTDGDVVGYYS
ncbi:MAG: peroxidase-related enzyme [Granulosicoccus sp.]